MASGLLTSIYSQQQCPPGHSTNDNNDCADNMTMWVSRVLHPTQHLIVSSIHTRMLTGLQAVTGTGYSKPHSSTVENTQKTKRNHKTNW